MKNPTLDNLYLFICDLIQVYFQHQIGSWNSALRRISSIISNLFLVLVLYSLYDCVVARSKLNSKELN